MWLGDYGQTISRSFFTLGVFVWLCVLSKRDGQVIMIRLLLKYFCTLLDISLLYVCPFVCVNSTPDPFNGQTANFTLKSPKEIESTTYVKRANIEYY